MTTERGPRARILVATPCYTGEVHFRYVESLTAAWVYCLAHNVELEVKFAAGALLQYSRNQLLREFLQGDYTHILWLDADVGFDPRAIMKLLDHDKDVIGGVYPMKCYPAQWPYNPMPGEQTAELHRASMLPGGFMLCSRKAMQAVADKAPLYLHTMSGLSYETPHVFDLEIDGTSLLGEDVVLCKKLRSLGFDIWCEPDINFRHAGMNQWNGNLAMQIQAGPQPLPFEPVAALRSTDHEVVAQATQSLWVAWQNEWAAPAGELFVLATLAKRSKRILEFGAGISTIVMAAANPDAEIHAIESDPGWAGRVERDVQRLGLTNVTIHQTGLDAEDFCYIEPADLPKGPYDLVFVDGPTFDVRSDPITASRHPVYTRFASYLEGAVVVVDDALWYEEAVTKYERFEVIGRRFAVCLPNEKPAGLATSTAA